MKKLLIIGIVIFTVVLGIFSYNKYVEYQIEKDYPVKNSTTNDFDYKEPNKNLNNDEIAYVAQKFVEKSLKAPSTAKFPSLIKSSVKKTSSDSYTVISYVDSQNGFGAMIRTNYIVELKQKSNGNLSLVNIKITE
jgi:hypothetical protein